MMLAEADVAIVGGGILGLSVAYSLAKRRRREVVLLEKGELAGQTTPQAAGLVGQLRSTDLMTRALIFCVKTYEGLAREVGYDPGFRQVGSVKVALTDEWERELARQVERGKRLGLEIGCISLAEAQERVPALDVKQVRAAMFLATDGYIDPVALALAYAKGAQAGGVKFLTRTRVTGIEASPGNPFRLITDRGEVRASAIVNAAGSWAARVAAMAGASVTLAPVRHQLYITAPLSGVPPNQPVLRIPDASAYCRPEGGGLLFGGFEETPLSYDPLAVPDEISMDQLEPDRQALGRLADRAAQALPILRDAPMARARAGLPTFTPDGEFLVGEAPGFPNFYIASGCAATGIATSAAIGELLAGLIVEGRSFLDLTPLRPDRFRGSYDDRDQLRNACEAIYRDYYAVGRGRL